MTVGCLGADFDRPTGFSRQAKMDDPSNVTNQVYHWACKLLKKHWNGRPVRKVGISFSQFAPDEEYNCHYLIWEEKRQWS